MKVKISLIDKRVSFVNSTDLPEDTTAHSPVSIHEEIDGCKQQHHRHWVIEETQHKDGVDSIGGAAHKEKHIGRNLG